MNFFDTYVSPNASDIIRKVLNSTFLSEGKLVKDLENKLNEELGLCKPVAVNSGTSALHLALAIAGIKSGDEVIIPAQTFVATGLAALMQNAKPVFADIQYETGNIDPEDILKKISDKTKAIIPVHWAGYPCDMDEINEIARENNLAVIEDAAHALGAVYKNRPIGSISRFTAFSFQAIKHLTTGDGGALCCLSDGDYNAARRRRWFGIDRENSKPSILGEREYDLVELGYKYHMNDYSAALGLANLEDLMQQLFRRKEIAAFYRNELKNISGLKLLSYSTDRQSVYWLFTILVERREDFIKKLKSKNIPTSVVHLSIDRYSILGGEKKDLVQQQRFNRDQVSIPIHSHLSDEDIKLIVETIQSGW